MKEKHISIRIPLLPIIVILFLLIFLVKSCDAGEYKAPSWQKRAINNYNYNQAIHGKESTTIENDKDAPSWQRRAIDNYNYDNAVHNRQKGERRKDND